jgi:hypothetical protein
MGRTVRLPAFASQHVATECAQRARKGSRRVQTEITLCSGLASDDHQVELSRPPNMARDFGPERCNILLHMNIS